LPKGSGKRTMTADERHAPFSRLLGRPGRDRIGIRGGEADSGFATTI
jgi:hypothetical protein